MADETGWVGRAEGRQLEFKREEAGDDAILDTIVAFLNTDGGRLVIGVDAPGPADVAIAEPGVREPHAWRDRIRQWLRDRIEPPAGASADVAVGQVPSGASVVIVEVKQSPDRPHAVRLRGGYRFVVREDAMNRVLGWAEARGLVGKGAEAAEAIREAESAFSEGLRVAREGAGSDAAALFVGFRPEREAGLREREWQERRAELVEALDSESPFGLRPHGFHFALSPHWRPASAGDRVTLGPARPLFRHVSARRDGIVWGALRLDPGMEATEAEDRQGRRVLLLRSIALVEFGYSVAVLAGHAADRLGAAGPWCARAAVISEHALAPVPEDAPLLRHTIRFRDVTGAGTDTGILPGCNLAKQESRDSCLADLFARLFDGLGEPDGWRRYFRDGAFRFP